METTAAYKDLFAAQDRLKKAQANSSYWENREFLLRRTEEEEAKWKVFEDKLKMDEIRATRVEHIGGHRKDCQCCVCKGNDCLCHSCRM